MISMIATTRKNELPYPAKFGLWQEKSYKKNFRTCITDRNNRRNKKKT